MPGSAAPLTLCWPTSPQPRVAAGGFFLARLTVELTRPVAIAPLRVRARSGRGRNARRVKLVIEHDGDLVAALW